MKIEIENAFKGVAELVQQAKNLIEEVANNSHFSGVPSGFTEIDRITSGWQPSDLILIAARPSIGKTSFILSMIKNISVDFGIPVAFFSTEMSSIQIINRLISLETGLSLTKLRNGNLEKYEWELLSIKSRNLEKAPIYIDDTANLAVEKLPVLCADLVSKKNIKIIFIDNIHLLSSENADKVNMNREHELSTIARKLKALAKELNIPIVVISQLSREIDLRGSFKRPILSDLRGSGTLEEIADIVSFIYRPEHYYIEEWDDDEAAPTQGQAEFIIAKNRNGSLNNIRIKFIQSMGKFEDLEEFSNVEYFDLSTNISVENNPFQKRSIPNSNEAFGSNFSIEDDSDGDIPF